MLAKDTARQSIAHADAAKLHVSTELGAAITVSQLDR